VSKRKTFKAVQTIITIAVIFGIIHIIDQYDKINEFYIQKKDKYSVLEKLHNEVLEQYQIDLENNTELRDLQRQVEYKQNMIDGLEPNTRIAKYYWWILIGFCWILILSRLIEKRIGNTDDKTA